MANTKSTTAAKRAKQAKRTAAAPAPAAPQRNGGNGANANLAQARRARNDEFYTQFDDIHREMKMYRLYNPDVFRGKVVYCNCDDPYESNFFRYFALNFNELGLKQLITTSYKPSPIANTELPLFGNEKAKEKNKVTANRFIINRVRGITDDFNLEDIAKKLRENKNNDWAPLKGNGDFRSEECVELLKQADIVVTNPPFSLFREFVKQLFDHNKKFVIIGSMNAITYREIFPLIKDNRMWLGYGFSAGNAYFATPHVRDFADGVYDEETGLVKFRNVCWFTNLEHDDRHEVINYMTMEDCLRFSKPFRGTGKTAYDKYENYDAIEVPATRAIPSDYKGVMGVPISFLESYNPDQFEIVGMAEDNGRGFSGGIWDGKNPHCVVDGKNKYKRIFIRHKTTS